MQGPPMSFLSEPSSRRVVLAAVGVIAVAALVVGPLRGTRSDIAQQKRDVHAQLAVTTKQLAHVKEQRLDLDKQLRITARQLEIATQQLELARKQGELTEDLVAMQRQLLQTLDLQRRLLAIAEQTLREVKEMNRKIPPPSS
jgi:hypothetical protein